MGQRFYLGGAVPPHVPLDRLPLLFSSAAIFHVSAMNVGVSLFFILFSKDVASLSIIPWVLT